MLIPSPSPGDPCHRTKTPGTCSLYPHWQNQGGQCKEKKKKFFFFFSGQIIKIQGRRRLCTGAVDWGPDRRPLAHSYSRGVSVLSFPRTADPEQLNLTSSGLSEAVGCMQPRLGMEAWGHEEVTQPENVGFHLPKDLRRQESLTFKIIDLLRVSGLVD